MGDLTLQEPQKAKDTDKPKKTDSDSAKDQQVTKEAVSSEQKPASTLFLSGKAFKELEKQEIQKMFGNKPQTQDPQPNKDSNQTLGSDKYFYSATYEFTATPDGKNFKNVTLIGGVNTDVLKKAGINYIGVYFDKGLAPDGNGSNYVSFRAEVARTAIKLGDNEAGVYGSLGFIKDESGKVSPRAGIFSYLQLGKNGEYYMTVLHERSLAGLPAQYTEFQANRYFADKSSTVNPYVGFYGRNIDSQHAMLVAGAKIQLAFLKELGFDVYFKSNLQPGDKHSSVAGVSIYKR